MTGVQTCALPISKAYRFVGDPRDGQHKERLTDLAEDEHGIYDCTHCFNCIEACPKGVAPMSQIMRLRRIAGADHHIEDRNNGHRHELAFVKNIERNGLLMEADPEFIGPAASAKAYRFVGDPRDAATKDRLVHLANDPSGIYDCTHCFKCVEVCPKGVAPMNQIMRLRRRATGDYKIKDQNNGYRHEKAFVSIIEKWGTLHEAKLLPDSYGEGILGKMHPDAQINLIGSLPTALRGLASGKVTIPKVLHHHKLPDIDKIKDIYEKVEGRPERIELNLYIVGDEAEMIDEEHIAPEVVAAAPTEGEGA